MVTKVRKWGDSQGLKLPRRLLEEARIEIGDDVEVVVGEAQITIKKVNKPKFDLAEMVARMPPDYRVREELL